MAKKIYSDTVNWLTADGVECSDADVLATIKAFDSLDYPVKVIVGTDSNKCGKLTKFYKFIIALCVYREHKGGTYFYKKIHEKKEKFCNNNKMRLFEEVTKSLEVANKFRDEYGITPIVHIDASNPELSKAFSSTFGDQLVGYAVSSGYIATLKPESFTASHIANKHSK